MLNFIIFSLVSNTKSAIRSSVDENLMKDNTDPYKPNHLNNTSIKKRLF